MTYPIELTTHDGGPAVYTPFFPGECFICGETTDRVDVCFEAYFCDSGICNWAIAEDTMMMDRRFDARMQELAEEGWADIERRVFI